MERQINYGVDENEKINLDDVKMNWNKLQIMSPYRKRLFEFLIWGK